ncbi:hydrolase [Hamadaea sp. NPDC050747]|uniref:hydrolase n=1 Tax=Hamadaea sp. NPDC050747 TaxID=3155789 RepID=UPI00340E61CD
MASASMAVLDSPGRVRSPLTIDVCGVTLTGDLFAPLPPDGLVIFALGSSGGRYDAHNVLAARRFNDAGLGTVLLDLLTPAEDLARTPAPDIALLANRLAAATRWLRRQHWAASTPIGWYGVGAAAGAALWAAAEPDADVAAIVAVDSQVALAADRLRAVRAPTLLMAGVANTEVLDANRVTQRRLGCPVLLDIIGSIRPLADAGDGHLAAGEALRWLSHRLSSPGRP